MAIINIKYSQNVVDQEHLAALNTPNLNGSIGTLVDAIAVTDYNVNKNYPYYSSWSLDGSTLRINFSDGATETYTGVVLDNPSANQGSATASGFEFYKDGLLTVNEAGKLNYDYVMTPSGTGYSLSFSESAKGSTTTVFRLATHLPSYSQAYDQLTGNVAVLLNGALNTSPSGEMSGSISKITATADKFLLSGVIEGNFKVAGNIQTAGQGLTHSTVDGVLSGYKEDYRDGSHAYITDVATYVNASQLLDETMLADATRFAGNDDISVDLPGHLYADFLMASGGGNDHISIKGGGGRLNVSAGDGNDQISILGDAHVVDGGSGIDTVSLAAARANYSVLKTATGYSLTDNAGAVSTLVNVERIAFTDSTVALDIGGNGGQAYRLYQAAFNRTPDGAGLGFWISVLDKGGSLSSIAGGFVNSDEFKVAYAGALSNHDLVTQFYQNILHRAPEPAGLTYWTGVLDTKAAGSSDVLAAISESGENQAGLIGVIGNGFAFTPYV
jgi:hypothetical protein